MADNPESPAVAGEEQAGPCAARSIRSTVPASGCMATDEATNAEPRAGEPHLHGREPLHHQYGHYNGAIDYFTHMRDGGYDWHRDDKTLRGDEGYLAPFRRAYGWFHGQNSLRQPLADVRSGACCDGLQPSGVNRNQGAESTLAYLWAELLNFEFEVEQASRRHREAAATLEISP